MKCSLCLVAGLFSAGLAIGQVVIQPGIAVYLNGTADVYLTDGISLNNAGTLSLGQSTLAISGGFANTGTIVPGTSTVLFNGAADQIFTAGNATLHNLTLNKPTPNEDEVLLSGEATLTGTLTLTDGYLRTGLNDRLLLASTANVAGESNTSYVRGNVEVSRSLSNAISTFGGVGVTLDAATNNENLGNVVVRRVSGLAMQNGSYIQNGSHKSIDRIWEIVPQFQPANGGVNVTLSWLPENDNGNTDFTQSYIWKSNDNGLTYNPVGTTQDATSRTITALFPSFSIVTVGATGVTFPVEFLDIEAHHEIRDFPQPQGGTASAPCILVSWRTATESNVSHFEVQRAIPDAQNTSNLMWMGVGDVKAVGNSQQVQGYEFPDRDIFSGQQRFLYRIHSVDVDGKDMYSTIAEAIIGDSERFQLYPNPVGDLLTALHHGNSLPSYVSLILYDALGREMGNYPLAGPKTTVDVRALAQGVYTYKVINGLTPFSGKIIKL